MISHLSPSQLDTFFRCGEQWRRRYIEGDIIPPGIALLVGSGVHKGAEVDLKAKHAASERIDGRVVPGPDLPVADVVDAAVTEYDSRIEKDGLYLTREEAPDVRKLVGEGKDATADLARLWRVDIAPVTVPDLIEQRVTVDVPEAEISMTGIVDLVEADGTLTDLKTAAKSWNQTKADENTTQLTIYKKLVTAKTGRAPSRLRFRVGVKLKTPKWDEFEVESDESDWGIVVLKMKVMLAAIKAGNFGPPEPGAWVCGPKYCGYWSTCQWVSDRKKRLANV